MTTLLTDIQKPENLEQTQEQKDIEDDDAAEMASILKDLKVFITSFKQKIISKNRYVLWVLGTIAGVIIMLVFKLVMRFLNG